MVKLIELLITRLNKQVPATGLGVFRILFGLVLLQELVFLLFFNHLIFDPIPYLDVEFILIPFFLFIWVLAACFLMVGYHTRVAAITNYFFWIIFTQFTPMIRDFDGGFDQFMIGSSFFMIFLPVERALSLDNLRLKIRHSTVNSRYQPNRQVTVLAYTVPIGILLGLLYFDSGIHKLYAEHWHNGLGVWLPLSMPYYISAIDLTWLLDIKQLQVSITTVIFIFQFVFLFLYCFRLFRVPFLFIGIGLHAGITLALNIYPFGLGMLIHYALLVPFKWWRCVGDSLKAKQHHLTVFYDEECPLCNRTVITIEHFDVVNAIEFKGLQTYARQYSALDVISDDQLLKDLYALDGQGRLYQGLDAYIQIVLKMKYPAVVGLILKIPGIYHLARRKYRQIADQRERLTCGEQCLTPSMSLLQEEDSPFQGIYQRWAGKTVRQKANRIAKGLVVILILQLNSTIHYGFVYRMGIDTHNTLLGKTLTQFSNTLLMFSSAFLGITPHALYLHDHFEGYDHILGLTYLDKDGNEKWLPFVNEQGRIVAPNWGRVHSMWANVAVTPNIDRNRLDKFLMKVTAFWGTKCGLDLSNAVFTIKMKEIRTPSKWEKGLRNYNIKQPWQVIGQVVWTDEKARIEIPDVDLEALSRQSQSY